MIRKLVFAYKFKHEDKAIVVFIAEGKEMDDSVANAMGFLIAITKKIGYQLIDMRDTLDSIMVEMEHGRFKNAGNKNTKSK